MLADVVLEDVGNALAVTVKTELPQALVDVQAEQAAKEAGWAAVLGPFESPALLPEPATWFVGHHPSLLERVVDDYPVIVVMAYDHDTATEQDPLSTDQTEVVNNRCYIEAAVAHPDLDIINRVAQRYAMAIHRAVVRGEDLGGAVSPIDRTPHVAVGGANRRRVSAETDAITYVQLMRLEYTFKVPQQW